MRRLFSASLVVLVCVPGFGEHQETQPPRLISGALPFFSALRDDQPGIARVGLVIQSDGRVVPTAEPTLLNNLASRVMSAVSDWRLTGPPGARVPVVVRFIQPPELLCSSDLNQYAEVRAPSSIDIFGPPPGVCTPAPNGPVEPIVRSSFHGRLVNGTGKSLSGVQISIAQVGGLLRLLRTDAGGRFEAHGLPDGRYRVEISHSGYLDQQFPLVVSSTAVGDDVNVVLAEDAAHVPPTAMVTAAAIAVYPKAALDSEASGIVSVRLSMSENTVTDIDPNGDNPILTRAAASNAATWHFEDVRVPVLTIKYVFKALPRDCSVDQRPLTRMHFPDLVEVNARAGPPCRMALPFPLGSRR